MRRIDKLAESFSKDTLGQSHDCPCDMVPRCEECSERLFIEFGFYKGFRAAIELLRTDEAKHLMKHPGNISEQAGKTLMSGDRWAIWLESKAEEDV